MAVAVGVAEAVAEAVGVAEAVAVAVAEGLVIGKSSCASSHSPGVWLCLSQSCACLFFVWMTWTPSCTIPNSILSLLQ